MLLYNNFNEKMSVKHKKMLSVYKHIIWVLLRIKFKLFRPSISIRLPVQDRILMRCTTSTYYFADFGLRTFGMFMIRILIIKIRSMTFFMIMSVIMQGLDENLDI